MLANETKIDPRVKRTRGLLQQALMDLAHEKPLDSITVQDIAARAEVNRATFYAHFDDKYALMDYTAREMFRGQLDAALSDSPQLTRSNLRSLVMATCNFIGEFIGHCAPIHTASEQAMMIMQVQTMVDETLVDWLRQAAGADGTASEWAAMTTSWAIWGSIFQWSRAGRKIPAAQLADRILSLLMPGLQGYLAESA